MARLKGRCGHCERSVNVRQLVPLEVELRCECSGNHGAWREVQVLCARCALAHAATVSEPRN